jgi:hypothetical protein
MAEFDFDTSLMPSAVFVEVQEKWFHHENAALTSSSATAASFELLDMKWIEGQKWTFQQWRLEGLQYEKSQFP